MLGPSDIGAYMSSDGGVGPRIVENVQLAPPRTKRSGRRVNLGSELEEGRDPHSWILMGRSKDRSGSRFTMQPGNPAFPDPAPPDPRSGYDYSNDPARTDYRGESSYAGRLRTSFTPNPAFDSRNVRSASGFMPRRRPPGSAAVSIRPASGGSLAEILQKAKDTISLTDLGINDTRLRRSAGGLLIEIPGPENSRRADLLAQRLRAALGDAALVSRPMGMCLDQGGL